LGLWLFGIIGYPMLAFGSAKYEGPAALQNSTDATPKPITSEHK
jgi:hypothetical protein